MMIVGLHFSIEKREHLKITHIVRENVLIFHPQIYLQQSVYILMRRLINFSIGIINLKVIRFDVVINFDPNLKIESEKKHDITTPRIINPDHVWFGLDIMNELHG